MNNDKTFRESVTSQHMKLQQSDGRIFGCCCSTEFIFVNLPKEGSPHCVLRAINHHRNYIIQEAPNLTD